MAAGETNCARHETPATGPANRWAELLPAAAIVVIVARGARVLTRALRCLADNRQQRQADTPLRNVVILVAGA
jgi:hypothetical protein